MGNVNDKDTDVTDRLRIDYINSLPQPFFAHFWGGSEWPVLDIDVETGLLRIDVCGRIELKHIGDVKEFIDRDGVGHTSESFYNDCIPLSVESLADALQDSVHKECDGVRAALSFNHDLDLDDVAATSPKAKAELAALRKDADRYRKLVATGKFCALSTGGCGLSFGYGTSDSKDQLDAAADALPAQK